MAVRRLREDLRLTREGLATAVRHHLEPGMIYRWESGKNSPSPEWRIFLAAFARRRGCLEAAAAFEEPLYEWKAIAFEPADRSLLTALEIILINRELAPDDGSAIPCEQYQEIVNLIGKAIETAKHARAAGREIDIIGEEQAAYWLRETGRPQKRKESTRGRAKG
jgi:transcriptional regulator with XRE-family HTH domain